MKTTKWIRFIELDNGWQWEVYDSELGATVGEEPTLWGAMSAAKKYWDECCNIGIEFGD